MPIPSTSSDSCDIRVSFFPCNQDASKSLRSCILSSNSLIPTSLAKEASECDTLRALRYFSC